MTKWNRVPSVIGVAVLVLVGSGCGCLGLPEFDAGDACTGWWAAVVGRRGCGENRTKIEKKK